MIQILEAKNMKEAQRIIQSIGRAKGGGNIDDPDEPMLEAGDQSDDDGYLDENDM